MVVDGDVVRCWTRGQKQTRLGTFSFVFHEPSIFTLSNVFSLESKRSALGPSRSSLFSSRAPVSTGSWQVWGQETGQSWILTRFTQVPSPRSGLAWLAEQGEKNTLVPPSGASLPLACPSALGKPFHPRISLSLSLSSCLPSLDPLARRGWPGSFPNDRPTVLLLGSNLALWKTERV